jgi:hypothetical protein
LFGPFVGLGLAGQFLGDRGAGRELRPDFDGKRVGEEGIPDITEQARDVPNNSPSPIDQATGVDPGFALVDGVLHYDTKVSSTEGGGELVGGEYGFIVIGIGLAVVSTVLGVDVVATGQRVGLDSVDSGTIGDEEVEGG